jgi:hypothetical protein
MQSAFRILCPILCLSVFIVARPSDAQEEEPTTVPSSPTPAPETSPIPTSAAPEASKPSPAALPPVPTGSAVAAFPTEAEPHPRNAPVTSHSVAPTAPPSPPTAGSQNVGAAPFSHSSYQDPSLSGNSGSSPHYEQPFAEPPQNSSRDDDSSDSLFRIGPVVGVGLPNLLSIGGMLKLTNYLGFGVNVGLIPSTNISFYGEATLSYQEYDVYGRLFPFGGGFFLGTGIGYATIKGTMKDSFNTSSYQIQAQVAGIAIPNPLVYESNGSVKTMIITPQIGYFYTTDIGFSIGLDLGAQIPIAPSDVNYESKLSLPSGTPDVVASSIQSKYVAPNDKKVKDTLETIGRTPLPTINLKVGWLF